MSVMTRKEIALFFGIPQNSVQNLARRKGWKCLAEASREAKDPSYDVSPRTKMKTLIFPGNWSEGQQSRRIILPRAMESADLEQLDL